MSKDTRWRYFSYLSVNYKAAQDTLNAWAREGWELVEVMGPFARLRRVERPDTPIYYLDWSNSSAEEKDYAQLLSDAGWEWVDRMGSYLNIYVSKPGASPLPIQTDPELEYQRFRKKALRSMVLSTLGVAILLLVCWFILSAAYDEPSRFQLIPTRLLPSLLSSSLVFSAVLCFLPFWALGGGAYFLYLFRRLGQWRGAVRAGLEPSVPGTGALRGWGLLRALGLLSGGVITLLFLPDALFNHMFNWGWGVGMLIGSLICIFAYDDPIRRRRGKRALPVCLLLVVCCLLHGPVREHVPGRLPDLSDSPVSSGAYRVSQARRTDALLGSTLRWHEDVEYTPEQRQYLYCFAQTWVSPALANWAFGPIPQGFYPVEGLEGVWRQGPVEPPEFQGASALDAMEYSLEDYRAQGKNRGTIRGYLIRRGTSQLTVECFHVPDDALDRELAAPFAAWLEQII